MKWCSQLKLGLQHCSAMAGLVRRIHSPVAAVLPHFCSGSAGNRATNHHRWMSTAQNGAPGPRDVGGVDPGILHQRSTAAAEQVKALGRKTWGQWTKDHQDELLVVLLSSMFLVTTLRLQRVKGERLDDQKENDKRFAKLQEEVENFKAEVRKSIDEGVGDVGKDLRMWNSQVVQLRAAMLKLVDEGINRANAFPLKQEVNASDEDGEEATVVIGASQAAPSGAKPKII